VTDWVRVYEDSGYRIESLGGTNWNDAPLPRWWHRCRPQTRGWLDLDYVERCACGAIRLSPGDLWAERNQTRRARARTRRDERLPRVQVTCCECGQRYEAVPGSPAARTRQCDSCWVTTLIASAGKRD
jgi:hypothetical protein